MSFAAPEERFIHHSALVRIVTVLLLLAGAVQESRADVLQQNQKAGGRLTHVSLEELGRIEVTTASKGPVPAARTSAAIYVITQEDIRRSGATSIPELLRLVPGLAVARIDSNKWSIGVRGFGSRLSRSVLVLIDGRSVYTPLFAGVYWEVQDALLEDIDRIEIIRGPGGTIWGANAVNGVINIITKNSKDTRGALVSAGGGNLDQGFANVRYGAGNTKSLNYRFYGKAFTRGPQFHADGRQFDDWRMRQTGFRADWDLPTGDTFTLQGDLYNGEAGQSVGVTSYSPPSTTNVEQNSRLAGANLVGRWRRVMGAGSDVQVQTYYDRTNRKEVNFEESRDRFDIDFIHRFTLPRRQNFTWGLGARLSSGNVTQVVPTVVFTPNHLTDKLYSAFVQDEIPIVGERLSLTIGSKFLHNNYTGFEAQPSARLLWTPSPQQTVWAAVTRAVRTPSRVEAGLQFTALLTPSPPTFSRVIGDGQFSSEQLLGYEVGYRNLVRNSLSLDLAAFYNDYDDLLSLEPSAPFSETSPSAPHLVVPVFIRNGLLGTASGVEIAADFTPTPWWRLKGSYSYLHIDLKRRAGSLDPSTANSTEGSSPNHQTVIQSFLDLPKNVEFDQTVRYVSSLRSQRTAGYATADLRFGWHATRGIELSVVGQNLLQPHHVETGGGRGACRVKARRLRKDNVAKVTEAMTHKRGMTRLPHPARGRITLGYPARLSQPMAMAMAGVLIGVSVLCAQQAKHGEYEVKAAYLYNFGRFVEWPAKEVANGAPFTICVLGRDPFGATLDAAVAGETIDGQKVVARRISKPLDAVSCRILFISASEDIRLREILTALDRRTVLTVSDMPQFSQRGGMVEFILDGKRVRFEVNLTIAEKAGLTLSSELLKVATAVRRDPQPGD